LNLDKKKKIPDELKNAYGFLTPELQKIMKEQGATFYTSKENGTLISSDIRPNISGEAARKVVQVNMLFGSQKPCGKLERKEWPGGKRHYFMGKKRVQQYKTVVKEVGDV
jgi:hypothetical protein